MQLGKGINNCLQKIETLKADEDDETKKKRETLKIASFKDISRIKILREGYIFLQKCFQCPDHQKHLDAMEEQNKNIVRHSLIFQRLATGQEQLKSFSSGYLDQCETQLRDLSLRTLLSIRITQPDFINAPDSLQRHARFTQTIDQILAEKVAHYFLNVTCYRNSPTMCSDEPLLELFDMVQKEKTLGVKSRRSRLLNIRRKNLGYEIMFVLGITSFLSRFSEQHVRSTMTLLVSENIQFHTTWWRFVLPVSSSVSQSKPCLEKPVLPTNREENLPNLNSKYLVDRHFKKKEECFENLLTAPLDLCKPPSTRNLNEKITQTNSLSLVHSSSEKLFGKTTSFIYETSKSNNMVAHGRLALQRSRSVDAVSRELLKGGTQLMNLFVKIPELYLTTRRPLTSDIFLCQNTNWAECQTIGQLTTAASDSSLRNETQFGTLYVFKLAPNASLDRFIRPMDAAQALRQELQGVVLSRNGTSHSSGHSQVTTNNFSCIVKQRPKKPILATSSLVKTSENENLRRSANSTIQFKKEKIRITETNSMTTFDTLHMTKSDAEDGSSTDTNSLPQEVICGVDEKWYLKQKVSAYGPFISFGFEKKEYEKNQKSIRQPSNLPVDLFSNNSCKEQSKLSNVLKRSHEFSPLGYLYKYKTNNPNTICSKKVHDCNVKNFEDVFDRKKQHIPTYSTVDILTPKTPTKKETNVSGNIQKNVSTTPATLKIIKDTHGSSKKTTFAFSKRAEKKEMPKTSQSESKEWTSKNAPSLYYQNILSKNMLSPPIHFLTQNNLRSTSKNKSCESSVVFMRKCTHNARKKESPLKKNSIRDRMTQEVCSKSDVVLQRIKSFEEVHNAENIHRKAVKEKLSKPPCNLQVFSLRQLTESHYLPKSLSKQDILVQDHYDHSETLHKNKTEYATKLKAPKIRTASSTSFTENFVTSLPNSNKLSDSVKRRVFHCNNLSESEKKIDLHSKITPVTFMSRISQFPKSYFKTTMSANHAEEKQYTKDKEHFSLEKTVNRMGVVDIPGNTRFAVSLQKAQPLKNFKDYGTKSALPVVLHQNTPSPFSSLPDCVPKKSVDTLKNHSLLLMKEPSLKKKLESQCFTSQLTPSRWDHWRYRSNSVLGLFVDKTCENEKFLKKN